MRIGRNEPCSSSTKIERLQTAPWACTAAWPGKGAGGRGDKSVRAKSRNAKKLLKMAHRGKGKRRGVRL